jgi:hypothetical protein
MECATSPWRPSGKPVRNVSKTSRMRGIAWLWKICTSQSPMSQDKLGGNRVGCDSTGTSTRHATSAMPSQPGSMHKQDLIHHTLLSLSFFSFQVVKHPSGQSHRYILGTQLLLLSRTMIIETEHSPQVLDVHADTSPCITTHSSSPLQL